MKSLLYVLFFMMMGSYLQAENIVYSKTDSLKLAALMNQIPKVSPDERILFIGKQFLDVPYMAGTLDREDEEKLVVNLSELDCTTFVENVYAIRLACINKKYDFSGFTEALEMIRYRGGEIKGYCSRLHYFSDWIQDNINKGILVDQTILHAVDRIIVSPFYMSLYADKYKYLKDNSENIVRIKEIENELKGTEVYYLPKTKLKDNNSLKWIKDGDIIAITTKIKGLDISHVGLAVWRGSKLYMMHASSKHKKVLIDPIPLYDYMQSMPNQTGIRIISLSFWEEMVQ